LQAVAGAITLLGVGWLATVSGQPAEQVPVRISLQSVALAPGSHRRVAGGSHLRATLKAVGQDVTSVFWEPLETALDDTGRSLLDVSGVDAVSHSSRIAAAGRVSDLHDYALAHPGPHAREIVVLCGAARVRVASHDMSFRFRNPLKAHPAGLRKRAHRVVLEDARWDRGCVYARIKVTPSSPLLARHQVTSHWSGADAPPALFLLPAMPSVLLESGSTSLPAGTAAARVDGTLDVELAWAGVHDPARVRGIQVTLPTQEREMRIPFVFRGIPLPQRGG